MLNEILIDPKEVELAKLKTLIKNFKAYDLERKNYYSEALQKLGELQSYVEELEDTDKTIQKIKELNTKIKNLQEEAERLRAVIINSKIEIPEDMDKCFLIKANYDLKEQNKALNKDVKKLTKTNKELVNRICELVNKLEKYKMGTS